MWEIFMPHPVLNTTAVLCVNKYFRRRGLLNKLEIGVLRFLWNCNRGREEKKERKKERKKEK